jgi:hypothetical protein
MAEWIIRIRQRLRYIWLGLTLKPIAGGDDGDGGEGDGGEGGEGAGAGSEAGGGSDGGEGDGSGEGGEGSGDGGGEGEGEGSGGEGEPEGSRQPDWKKQARANETRAKKAERARDSALAKLREHENKNKTEREKELEKAREEATTKARKEAEAERRQDRLENSVIREAAKGIKIGEGDDAQTARFRDPEDALLHLNRAIAEGEVDADDIFTDEGKVKSDVVRDALAEILDSKSYLRAAAEEPKPKRKQPEGGGDGGKGGDGSEGKSLEDMSVEEHYQRIRKGEGTPTGASK